MPAGLLVTDAHRVATPTLPPPAGDRACGRAHAIAPTGRPARVPANLAGLRLRPAESRGLKLRVADDEPVAASAGDRLS